MFLSHSPLLFFRFEDISFTAEVAKLTSKHLVATQLTLQRTVVKRNLYAWAQTYLVEALLTITKYPRLITLEGMFQSFTNHLVCLKEIRCRDAFSVWRVGNHYCRLLRLCEVFEVLLLHGDVVGKTCRTNITQGGVNSLHVNIIAVDVVLELALFGVVVIHLVEELCVEVVPLLEGKLLAEQSWCHVMCYECSLNKQGAATAHRVNEVGLAAPSAHKDNTRSKDFVEGRFHTLLTIASTVQTLAAGVETQCCLVLGDVYVQTDIW